MNRKADIAKLKLLGKTCDNCSYKESHICVSIKRGISSFGKESVKYLSYLPLADQNTCIYWHSKL